MDERYVKLIISGSLVLIWLGVTRGLVILAIARAVDKLQQRRIRRIVRTTTTFFLLGLLLLTWARELRGVALALGAFSVALVVGSKELILNFLGWVVKIANRTHHIGDRIRVAGICGEVLDAAVLGSRVRELDPITLRPTGRTISLPHSLLVNNSVLKEPGDAVVWDEFQVRVKNDADLTRVEAALVAIVAKEAAQATRSRKQTRGGANSEPTAADGTDSEVLEPPVSVFVDVQGADFILSLRYRIAVGARAACRDQLARRALALTTAPAAGTDSAPTA